MKRKVLIGLTVPVAIIIYDRAGNISLLIVTIILTALIFLRAKSQVDVPALTAYNTNN